MRRRLALGIVVVVLVASLAVYAMAYQASQNAATPQLVLVYRGDIHSGALNSYCWPNSPTNGTCSDPINVKALPALGTLITENSSIAFQVVGYSNPSQYHIAIWTSNGGNTADVVAVKTISNSLPVDLPAGDYYISAFAQRSDGRAVGYTFEITVVASG